MKILPLIMIVSVSMFAASDMERSLKENKQNACEQAKKQARSKYNITHLNPSCSCERTDGREWQCDVYFTYSTVKKSKK